MSMLILPSSGARVRNRLTNLSHFAGVNGTNMSAYTPEKGSLWTVSQGGFDLQSGAMHGTASGQSLAWVESGTADHVSVLTGWLARGNYATSNWNVLGRYQDTQNYWNGSIANGLLRIFKTDSVHGFVEVASAAVTLSLGTIYTLTMTTKGSSIYLTLSTPTGTTTISVVDTFLQSVTKVGVRQFLASDSDIFFDEFYVRPL